MKQENVVYRYGNGTTVSMVRLRADAGKALTLDEESFYGSVDVASPDGWYEVDDPDPPEETVAIEDKAEGYDILTGAVE